MSKEKELSDAGLAGQVLRGNENKVEESSFDIAVELLLSNKVIYRRRGDGGRKGYVLAA